MFVLEKRFPFEASHCLQHHDSKCSRLHGHSYVLVVEVATEALVSVGPKKGMVMDFDEITSIVRPVVDKFLDHQHLNDTLSTDAPTAEYIAYWVYMQLKPHIPHLSAVTVEETATARATYRPKSRDDRFRIEDDLGANGEQASD
jgi:6-pyruvoyltetrahydropterin/6-carboxytetrahydropterin synthase